MFNSVIFYSIVTISAAILYRGFFQGKIDPSIMRRVIWDILFFSFILIPVNIFFQRYARHKAIMPEVRAYIILIYIIGTIGLSLFFIVNFLRLLNIKRQSERFHIGNLKCYIHNNSQLGCFSWWNNIYLPKNFKRWNEKEIKMVISHENAHIHQGHSIDLEMIQILCIFQWYNPAIWYFKKELQRIHEYEADLHVVKNTEIKKKSYEYFLLKENTSQTLGGTVQSFKSKSLRHRIIMMNHKSPKKNWVERESIILILSILISFFF